MTFLTRDAGLLALLIVAQASLAGRGEALSFAAIGNRLAVSRTHISKLFAQAQAAGYVRLGKKGAGAPIEILPPLWEAYDHFLADILANHDAIAQAAFAAIAEADLDGSKFTGCE